MAKYIVGLRIGGEMGQPEIQYTDQKIVEADSKEEAIKLYNDKYKWRIFDARCIGKMNEDESATIFKNYINLKMM